VSTVTYEPSSTGHPDRVVAVVGPTAVGKTALAEELAIRLGGEIISADSMQVYRMMDIGTAKPRPSDRHTDYHCIDLADPDQLFSAALYQKVARTAISQVSARGSLPIVAGGSGLYVRAALDDWSFPPGEAESPERQRLEALARDVGAEGLHSRLHEIDPESAAIIHPANVRRTMRALEIAAQGGSYAEQARLFSERRSIYDTVFLGMTMDRQTLYDRIDQRVDAMISAGLVEEVRRLLDAGFREALTAAQAIGYKELVPVIEKERELAEAIEGIKRATRRYAKRQLTWFRADRRIRWIDVTGHSLGHTTDLALGLLQSDEPSTVAPEPGTWRLEPFR